MKKIKRVTVHAGHNPSGKIACGAAGILDESKEARIICRKVVRKLRMHGIRVKNCTVNNGKSQEDVLRKICAKCNMFHSDIDISIHLNSGRCDKKGDGKTGGVEVLLTENKDDKGYIAERICVNIGRIGFTNRGVKENNHLYFLKYTNSPAILIEACFVDDKDDAKLFKKSRNKIANAIVQAVLTHNKVC